MTSSLREAPLALTYHDVSPALIRRPCDCRRAIRPGSAASHLGPVAIARWRRVLFRAIAIGSTGLIFVGCTMVGPNFKTPPAPVAKTYLGPDGQPLPERRVEITDWWKVFKDPTLTHLVDVAAGQNLTVLSAGTRVLQARAELGIASGGLYPQSQALVGGVNYNRLSKVDAFSLTNPPGDFWRATFGAQIAWELDFWGKFRRGIESAGDSYLASIENYDDALVVLLGDVATTYIGIRSLQKQIDIAQSNIARQRKALSIAENRFNEGSTTRLDVFQAQNVLGATEARVPQLNIQLQQGLNALRVLLGMAPESLDKLLETSSGIPIPPRSVAVGIPADLLRRRPDVRAAELRAAAQSAQIGVAEADLYPSFSLLGDIGLAAADVGTAGLGDMFQGRALTFSVGPSLHWNVLNYGQITNNVRAQDAKFQSLLVDYQNTVLRAQKEVEDGVDSFVLSRQEATFLQQSLTAAQGAVDLAFDQYNEGLSDFTTVLTAEQNLLTAENNLATTKGAESESVARIYQALGGGWQIRAGKGFVPPATREEMTKRTNWGDLLPPGGAQRKPTPAGHVWEVRAIQPPEW